MRAVVVQYRDLSPEREPADPSAEYRQRARRLRGRLRHDPGHMHRSLRQLSDEMDKRQVVADPPERDSGADFAREIIARMEGSVLRYSARLELLEMAEVMGIGRFEANLIIAAMQHRRGPGFVEAAASSKGSWLWTVAAVVAVQATIGAGLWWMLGR